MTGQSTGIRIGQLIGTLLLQAVIAYLIASVMHKRTVSKVITLMEGLQSDVKISG